MTPNISLSSQVDGSGLDSAVCHSTPARVAAKHMIGVIVQARMGSTRLPDKVLLEAAGKPLLGHLIQRLSFATTLDRVIVATSIEPRDDVIANYCRALGVLVFRGSESDVLDRYYQAARRYGLDVIVRIPADCPLMDPAIVDAMVRFFLDHDGQYDLVTSRYPLTYPDGIAMDVIPLEALEFAWRHAAESHQREHTVPFFWESRMRVYNVEHPDNLFRQYRWTLDYPEDYELIRRIFEALYKPGYLFTMQDILEHMAQHPELGLINAHYLNAH